MGVLGVVVVIGIAFLIGRTVGGGGPVVFVPAVGSSSSSSSPASSGDGQNTSSSPPTTASPSTTGADASGQARQLDRLLDDAGIGRGLIASAVVKLGNCDGSISPGRAVRDIERAAASRAQLLDRLARAQVDALPHGADLQAGLRNAWTLSLTADRHYLAWARGIERGAACGSTPEKRRGDDASSLAVQAKQDFVESWNRDVVEPFGLLPRKEAQL
jgi:hypothetical protein